MSSLPVWVTKWWDVANDRRQRLIVKKHMGKRGLTKAQDAELIMLQKVAEAIMTYACPIDFKRLERLEKLVEKIQKAK